MAGSLTFEAALRSYWDYYRELENDFLATRKYVAFEEGNFSTYSLEFLKLYQAVCGEVDVLGKTLAGLANPEFKPDDRTNGIYKWWHEIQRSAQLYDSAEDAVGRRDGTALSDCSLMFLGRVEMTPWAGFATEWRTITDRHGNTSRRCLLVSGSSTPAWWSDYNKVKHSRALGQRSDRERLNYARANLRNVAHAFAALYILETCLLQSVGTLDDLEAFANMSGLFVERRFVTSAEIKDIVEDAFK